MASSRIVSINDLSGHVYTMQEHIDVSPARRRQHSPEFKAQVVKACSQPGISVAAVALRYRLNANLLRRWVAAHAQRDGIAQAQQAITAAVPEFVPLQLPPPSAAAMQEIVIEVRRSAATVTVRWPTSAAADCATWLQGWLR
jgi:transposase